jgi:hypothetical protein
VKERKKSNSINLWTSKSIDYVLDFRSIGFNVEFGLQVVLGLVLAVVSGRPEPRKLKSATEEFADFKIKFGKVYRDIREEASRFQIFQVCTLPPSTADHTAGQMRMGS